MAGQQAAAVVALIQKQAGGITLVKAHLITDAVFEDFKPFRCGFAEKQLR